MILTIGFSPCPNDTFIFDALVNQKIDTGELRFDPVLEDVETLNQWAMNGKLDITKLSFPAYFKSITHYDLLDAGSALGKGVGPLLVAAVKNKTTAEIFHSRIAIPGINTTANFLLSFAFPGAGHRIPMIFSSIEDAVLEGTADLGVIIHENRFTYRDKGLFKILDLGKHWEEKMNLPVPLGGITVHKRIPREIAARVNKLILQSLEHAWKNYPQLPTYVKEHSQAMEEGVMRKHIELYVNEFSLSLGGEGRRAIEKFYEVYLSSNPTAGRPPDLFL